MVYFIIPLQFPYRYLSCVGLHMTHPELYSTHIILQVLDVRFWRLKLFPALN